MSDYNADQAIPVFGQSAIAYSLSPRHWLSAKVTAPEWGMAIAIHR
jgi:hypothetical protein